MIDASFYYTIQTWTQKHSWIQPVIFITNYCITKLMYLLYPSLLIYYYLINGLTMTFYQLIIIPAITFLALSFIRKKINAPRPYEKYEIVPIIPRESVGQSMPSRHVFSATIISMCFFTVQPLIATICLLLTALLAICRVIGGVHFIQDVLVAIIIGIISGLFTII